MWEELHYYWHKINNLWKWEPRPDQLLQQIKTVLCCQKEDWSLAGSGDKAKLHMWHDNRKRPKASVPMCLRNNPVFSCQRDQWAFWTEHPPFPKRHLGLFWIMGLLRCKALYSRDFHHTSGTCISILWCTGRAVTQWACLWLSSPFPLPHPSLLLSRAFLFRLTSLLLWQSPIKLSSRAGWKAVFPVPWECRVLNIYVYYIYKTWFWSKLNRNFSQFFFFLKRAISRKPEAPQTLLQPPSEMHLKAHQFCQAAAEFQHPWPWGKSTRCICSEARDSYTPCFSCPGRDLPEGQVGFLKLSSSGMGKVNCAQHSSSKISQA